MLALWFCGVNFTDSKFLLTQYPNDIDYIYDQVSRHSKKKRYIGQINLSDIITISNSYKTKDGTDLRKEWRDGVIKEIEKLDKKVYTLFDEIKDRKQRKKSTLFDKIKYLKKRGIK